jgi:sugar lactone lactonase YvrE
MTRRISALLLSFAISSPPGAAQFVPGDLYIGSDTHIYRIDPLTWKASTFADATDGLTSASSVAFSPLGTLLCANFSPAEVFEFDSGGTGTVVLDASDGLSGPLGESGLAYDSLGDLYICDYLQDAIIMAPAGGGQPLVFADSSDGLSWPIGLSFSRDDVLYIANCSGKNILTADTSGNVVEFDKVPDRPFSVAVRRNGDVYALTWDAPGTTVYRYPGGDATQRAVLAFFPTLFGGGAIQLSLDDASLYLTSYGAGNLVVIGAESGAYSEVIAPGGLIAPAAITIAGSQFRASWSNYGAGLPGTSGVPSFAPQADPILGTSLSVILSNSYGQPTFGLVLLGFQRANIHSALGGTLFLVPTLAMPVTFSFGSDTFAWTLPADPSFAGVAVMAQALEADPGAIKGVSFTEGLEFLLGY